MPNLPPTNQLLKTIYDHGAEAVRVVSETGRTLSLEVVSRRDYWEAKIGPTLLEIHEGELRGIEKVSGDPKVRAVETGGGTYRYTVVLIKF